MTTWSRRAIKNSHAIYDVLYGFVPITEWEAQIINSPFYQRLRWIKQLGFTNMIFPGAEHNRFSHAIGVMHTMEQMIRALGIGVSESELFDPKATSEQARLHKSLRIAALIHDIGTFPFSHAVEYSYLRHGTDSRRSRKKPKSLPNSHEHLGSFIIKNTRFDGGITRILEEFGFDVQLISNIIKGDSKYLIANQLMHSDLDADRLDYLVRDAHYTGLRYGMIDREYILSNLATYEIGKSQLAFGVKESAMHAVEDYLMARFNWYSQVIRNSDAAKFDILATQLAKTFLEKDLIYQFQDLLSMIEKQDERFFWWNDIYFITRCQEIRYQKQIKDKMTNEMIGMLLFRKPPKTLVHEHLKHRIIQSNGKTDERERLITKIKSLTSEMRAALKKHGNGGEWILEDIPSKDVSFTSGLDSLIKKRTSDNLYAERDPVKIVSGDGSPSLLVERNNSVMKALSNMINFIPSVYANDDAAELLSSKGLSES